MGRVWKPFALIAFFLLVSGKIEAAGAGQGAQAEPVMWTVDGAASKIEFASMFSGMPFHGSFKTWTAQIAFDPKALAASKVSVTIDLASAFTGDQTRDEALPTADWFDVMKFPRATFVSKSFKDLGGGRFEATGDLSLHGIAKEVVLPFTLAITGDEAAMKGSFALRRDAFHVGTGSFAEADSVPYEVGVTVTVKARRAR